MSTVQIRIVANRGSTTYEFESDADSYREAEIDATAFEKWLNEQSERFAFNDTQQRSTR